MTNPLPPGTPGLPDMRSFSNPVPETVDGLRAAKEVIGNPWPPSSYRCAFTKEELEEMLSDGPKDQKREDGPNRRAARMRWSYIPQDEKSEEKGVQAT